MASICNFIVFYLFTIAAECSCQSCKSDAVSDPISHSNTWKQPHQQKYYEREHGLPDIATAAAAAAAAIYVCSFIHAFAAGIQILNTVSCSKYISQSK